MERRKRKKTHLTNASLRPRRRNRRVCDVEDDPVLLLRFGQPSRELELTHAGESMATEDLHDGGLIEVGRGSADGLEGLVKLGGELGDGDVAIGRDDGDGLQK